MNRRKRCSPWVIRPFLFLFLCLGPLQAFGKDFPAKPITIICGMEPGATVDVTTRALAEEAQKILGVPVVVENKPGGGATVAAALLATKKPDGYTLGVLASSVLDIRSIMMDVAYEPKDFTFILSYANFIGGICVRKDSPFKTLNELLDHARKSPELLSYSSSGIGANQTLAVDYLARQANVKFKHVPFKGGTPACTALIGGHVDFTAGAGIHLMYVKQDVFRMLAVTIAEKRDPDFPDVPTLKDLGYRDLPCQQFLVVSPKGLPDPAFQKLEPALRQAVHSDEFQKVLRKLSLPFSYKNRRELEGDFPRTYQFYADFLKELGIAKEKRK